ncbi:hypothetical protein QT970_06895 [Microcoleus sp. herbarium8]|uniref:hypothetical protein n=1 Tax=Microcoleus sp. herbarium8 TaxID=3055436 RepID=UPI002FCEEF5B
MRQCRLFGAGDRQMVILRSMMMSCPVDCRSSDWFVVQKTVHSLVADGRPHYEPFL